ncbi:MAG TPA: hypothetical protein VGQ06_13735 [Gemmatimonadales bacterium]|jgi:hypothetical protein|nr:hypothetical protein [Gemmatimonadales bacterium]
MTSPGAEPISRGRVWWYRVAIAVLLLGEGYLVLSGRLAASFRHTTEPLPPAAAPSGPNPEFFLHFATNALWIAFLAPLAVTVWRIATRDRAASAGAAYWQALKTVFVVAWQGERAYLPEPDAADEVIEDDPLRALLAGLATAIIIPAFFWFGPAPLQHDVPTGAWLAAVGCLMGASVYCMQRARPHLKESWLARQRRRFFRRWYSTTPNDYNPPGNRWMIAYWIASVAAVISWVAGGALAFGFAAR